MLRRTDFYIDGRWTAPVEAKDFPVVNPADEQPFATISLGSAADVDKAVDAARRAFATWSLTSREERLALLEKLAALYEANADEMARTISREMGAPMTLAIRAQASAGLAHIRTFIAELKAFRFEHPLKPDVTGEHIVLEPIGVAASSHRGTGP